MSMPNSNSAANSNNVNTVKTAPQQNSINTDENPEIPLVVNKIKNTSSENSSISNRNKSVTVNALFDSRSDSTLLAQNVASYLNLNGKEQSITFSYAISQKLKVKSRLVSFSLSSKLHPLRIKFENVLVVNELNLMPYKINQNFHKQFEHLKHIHFDTRSSDVSLLIGADMSELHLPNGLRKGNKNEPVGIKLVLGLVLLSGNNKEKYSLNSNQIFVFESNIHDSLKQFWQIESDGTSNENPETSLATSEQKAIEILNKTVCKEKLGYYSVGLLWKNQNTKLRYNREIAVSRLKSLGNKFKKEQEFFKKYQQTIESYLKNSYATKLNTKLYNENNDLVNYIPHHGVKNVNKPGKIPILFDAGAKCNNTLLDENLLKGPDYLSKLISILIKF